LIPGADGDAGGGTRNAGAGGVDAGGLGMGGGEELLHPGFGSPAGGVGVVPSGGGGCAVPHEAAVSAM
jgi:hypothetical protein